VPRLRAASSEAALASYDDHYYCCCYYYNTIRTERVCIINASHCDRNIRSNSHANQMDLFTVCRLQRTYPWMLQCLVSGKAFLYILRKHAFDEVL
jgi:hypothetical protein